MEGNSIANILGWVSIACWFVVFTPQLYENYRRKSGEGLSVAFIVVWLLGDLFNLVGAVIGGLLSTVIILALYYSLCDAMLLCQVYYYRWIGKLRHASSSSEASESSPLIPSTKDTNNTSRSDADSAETTLGVLIRYTAALAFVCITGIVAWWVSEHFDDKSAPPPPPSSGSTTPTNELMSQFFGWFSALLYIGARIPQISKNVQTKCEGLSPALFFYSIVGNLTYSMSICSVSTDIEYLIRNAGWLAGSTLTIFLDIFVMGQFLYYRSRRTLAN